MRLQHQRIRAVSARDPGIAARRNEPAAVLARTQQSAKQASESKRGQHSQSIEPSRPTRAAVLQSPISA
jgi:hypothetical protein